MRDGDEQDRAAKRLLQRISSGVRDELRGATGAPLRISESKVERSGDEAADPGFGWFTNVARPHPRSDRAGTFTLYLETCVGDPSRLVLGCWYAGDWKTVQPVVRSVERTWRVARLGVYKNGEAASKGVRERPNVGEPFVDRWTRKRWSQHVGLYVARSPTHARLGALVRDSLRAIVLLSEAVAESTPPASARATVTDWDVERTRQTREVLARPRQAPFRRALLREFERCIVSGESCPEALEGAHIDPVQALGIDHPKKNGLLLRADLHLLFDRGLLRIIPGPPLRVEIAKRVTKGSKVYRDLVGPLDRTLSPVRLQALRKRNRGH